MSAGRILGCLVAGAVLALAGCAQDDRLPNPFIVDPPPQAPKPLSADQAAKMSEFLARWGRSVGASYKRPADAGDCTPVVSGLLFYGQLADIRAVKSCGPAVDDRLIVAIQSAGRPKIPEALAGSLEGRWIGIRFYDRSGGADTAAVEVALSTEGPAAARQRDGAAKPVSPPPPPLDTSASGPYGPFLHAWACQISATYHATPGSDGSCVPSALVEVFNGHVVNFSMVKSCNAAADHAFSDAVRKAPRPAMPADWAGKPVNLLLSLSAPNDPRCAKSP